ncbi:zinc ribbon domain-containing protein [Clostridium merdae]|uniref:zinc ribbon domain-containing protein n=1 Tax=Clostridium merdae TaxID=1958780 RepID=UPI001356643A|nr:zinc ribbon domain-containing protein [Clostridium merdae]
MFCFNCGTKILDNSKFCYHCGQKIALSEEEKQQILNETQQNSTTEQVQRGTDAPKAPVSNSNEVNRSTQSNTSSPNDSAASTNLEEKNRKAAKHFVLGVLGFVLVIILFVIIGLNSEPAYSSNYKFTSNGSNTSTLTPEQKKIRKAVTEDILYNVENTVKNDCELPDTAVIMHDKSKWNIENSLFTFGGTVSCQNKEGLEKTEPFTLKLFISEKKLFRVYAKLGSKEFYNIQNQYSTMGAIKNSDTQEMDLTKNMEGKLLTIHDKDYEKATLEEFQRIKTGMTYAEVCDIFGSLGTLSGQTSESVNVYTWAGNGEKDSQAIITFIGQKVFLTAQVGLK